MNEETAKKTTEEATSEAPGAAQQDAGAAAEDLTLDQPAEEAAAPAPGADEVNELKDRLLRTLADMENLRRRTERDVEEARKYAVTSFARDLLEVADNLARALASVPAEERERNEALKSLALGIEMTERTLLGQFEKHRIRKVDPQKGDKFDHNFHQAMFEVPTADLRPGSIAEVLQPGYVIADRLLRPAMVGVAKAPAGNGEEASAKADSTNA
jgi:molecular chaperone GrpE